MPKARVIQRVSGADSRVYVASAQARDEAVASASAAATSQALAQTARTSAEASAAIATTKAAEAAASAAAAGGGGGAVSSVAGRTGAVTLAVADVAGAAPLASPALTGAPTAPTAAGGTNTTQIATTAFVQAALPAVPVSSVAGRTGAVTLAVADVSGAVSTSRTLTAGTGLSGGGDLSANRTFSLANTSVSAGTYGSATLVPVLTIDAQGRVTSASTIAVSGGGGGATDLSYVAATRLLESSTGADVTLPLVTSTAAGLVPATGGGTANFLRADGAFAAPTMPGRVWPSGAWGSPHVSAINTVTAVAVDTLYLSPFQIFRGGVTISEIGLRIVTGATGNVKAGIYEYDEATDQFNLLRETSADVSTVTAAFTALALASSLEVTTPRVLWVGTVFSGTPVMAQWSPTNAHGGGMHNWIAIPNPPGAAISNTNSGFARVTRTAALTYVAGSAFLPSTIAYSGLTFSSAASGSPVAYLRKA